MEFKDEASLAKALQLDGSELNGRFLLVNEAGHGQRAEGHDAGGSRHGTVMDIDGGFGWDTPLPPAEDEMIDSTGKF